MRSLLCRMPRLALSLTLCLALPALAQAQDDWKEDMKKARKELAHKKRRVIINNDSGDATVHTRTPTVEAFLETRTKALAGTHVDAIFYCTSRGTFGAFSHKTEVGEMFTSTEGRYANNLLATFLKQGTDPLHVIIGFCREHGMDAFWSMRMNDTHDSWGYEYEDLITSQLKKDHPEWLVSSAGKKSKYGGFKAANYAVPEIRDLAFQYIQEVCRNYDIDGFEMDFFRHPVFFKSHAWGKPVTDEERAMMTDFVRRVRAMADEEGHKRGKPILVAVRVQDSAEYCHSIGLDIEQWLKEGLVDIMSVGGYFRLNPWSTSVELGHKYGVPVNACLSETRLKDKEAAKIRKSHACYRGRALTALEAGAHGIYLFNAFNPNSPIWSELGDPNVMRKLERDYTTGARGYGSVARWHPDGKSFMNRYILNPHATRTLKPGEGEVIELNTGETESLDGVAGAILMLRFDSPRESGISVSLNGAELTRSTWDDNWLQYTIKPSAELKRGMNSVRVALDAEAGTNAEIQDVALRVKPAK